MQERKPDAPRVDLGQGCGRGAVRQVGYMSHTPNVYSPPGTPLLDRTVGELVAERPSRSRVFQTFKIDFCCQGGRTLRDACERKGLAPETVAEQLEAELADKTGPARNPAELPLQEL